MLACTFFGHRDTPQDAEFALQTVLLDQCDYVVTYVNRPVGGAAKFEALARKKRKTVINLKDYISC